MRRDIRRLLPTALLLALASAEPAQAEDGGPPLTRIAFGSCAQQDRPQPIWDAVLDYRPELFVFLGDNVYGDVTSAAMAELEQAYARAAAIPGYRRVIETIPVLAIWDDHDYGQNDGGADFPFKAETKRLFLDFWGTDGDDPRHEREGIYHSQTFGPEGMRLQVILLDTRTFRSPLKETDERDAPGKERYLPDPDPAKTLLGEAQWAWLRERLLEPADLRLVASSIQVLADGHGWERWGNLPLERQRLLDLIEETAAGRVVLLSGDRHVGALYRLGDGVAYPLHEVTASGINMTYAANREPGPRRLGGIYGAENFGTIDIDWWAGEIRLAIRAINGSPVRELNVPLEQIEPG